MAKAKKVQKYVPTTVMPAREREYKVLEKSGNYNDFYAVLAMYRTLPNLEPYAQSYYNDYEARFKSKELDEGSWKTLLGEWRLKSLYNRIFPLTPEFDTINNAFLAEYDSRGDLQELYRDAFGSNYWVYDKYGEHMEKQRAAAKGWDQRPESFMMYQNIIHRCTEASKKIELARDTPYLEGDLVMLRKPFIGNRHADPLWVNPYSQEYHAGARCPDENTPRIGTVIAVTDKISNWRAAKGDKIIQLVWMGSEDMVNVEEKYIKWHERPTYKNGMKKRPENRE